MPSGSVRPPTTCINTIKTYRYSVKTQHGLVAFYEDAYDVPLYLGPEKVHISDKSPIAATCFRSFRSGMFMICTMYTLLLSIVARVDCCGAV